jgi:hypothetical protein
LKQKKSNLEKPKYFTKSKSSSFLVWLCGREGESWIEMPHKEARYLPNATKKWISLETLETTKTPVVFQKEKKKKKNQT